MAAHATTRAFRRTLAATAQRLELAIALVEASAAAPSLWAARQRADAIRILREAQIAIAGPAIRPPQAAPEAGQEPAAKAVDHKSGPAVGPIKGAKHV